MNFFKIWFVLGDVQMRTSHVVFCPSNVLINALMCMKSSHNISLSGRSIYNANDFVLFFSSRFYLLLVIVHPIIGCVWCIWSLFLLKNHWNGLEMICLIKSFESFDLYMDGLFLCMVYLLGFGQNITVRSFPHC